MTTQNVLNLNAVDSSWRTIIRDALTKIQPSYLEKLTQDPNWLPGPEKIFNAFSLPVDQVNYVLFGESPYPREKSANGYAFWDAAVDNIWSTTGLSKTVNRATSLRNIIKMLLIADGALDSAHTSQDDIAKLDKSEFIQTNADLFGNFLKHGFLLLNATPVLQAGTVRKDALAWQPFIRHIMDCLCQKRPQVQLLLFGGIANAIDNLINHLEIKRLYAEHPYNISFIHNPDIIQFFRPFHLLKRL